MMKVHKKPEKYFMGTKQCYSGGWKILSEYIKLWIKNLGRRRLLEVEGYNFVFDIWRADKMDSTQYQSKSSQCGDFLRQKGCK